MRRIINLFVIVGTLSLVMAGPVGAQGEAPYIIRTTTPVPAEVKAQVDAWLVTDPPSTARYYIVTYYEPRGAEALVSLAGVNLETPDSPWRLEDPSEWLGSVIVRGDGSVEMYNPLAVTSHGGGLMRARMAGGGSYVMFPFYNNALYGPRGVHGSGDYGTSGMLFVDLVGGDDMGVASMPPKVIASATGTVDYVCDDGVSVAVRTHNNTTGDYFLYAHMLDNANLTIGHTFQQSQLIGSLKYGSFDDTCGWAEQNANHYHVHWGFVPASGKYQVGACVLTVSSQTWACGSKTIKTGGSLAGGGGFSGSGETNGTSGAGSEVVSDPTFWDYVLGGVISFIDITFVKVLPAHGSSQFIYVFYNTIEMLFRLVRVLVYQSISIYPLIYAIGFIISLRLLFFVVWVVLVLLRAWKQLVPVIGA